MRDDAGERHLKPQKRADEGERRAVAAADQGDVALRRQIGVEHDEDRGQNPAEDEVDDKIRKGREAAAETGHPIHPKV